MPMFSEANDSTTRRRSPVLRLLATGALTLLAGGIIAGCAATAPAAPTATAAPKAEVATVAPAAPTEPTATAAAPEGVPPGPPPGGAGAPPKVITPTLTNIAYATASGTQMLDLYLPEGNEPFPVVINIHPGGFFTGDKDMVPGTPGKAMLEAGYAIASINYRLSGEATFPAAVQDAKAAVRFLRANAAEYKLNPDKIAAFGQSAGGNLASMLGTSGNIAEFDDPSLGNAGISSRVQAVINWFGPNDFAVLDEQAKAQGCSASDQTHSAADSPESKYLGAPVPTVPDLVNQANPITYITEDDPPFLVQKGDQDCTIAIENTKMLADALAAAGLDVRYDLLQGVGHGDGFGSTTPVFESEENSQALVDFLNTKLGIQPPAALASTATPAAAAASTSAAPAAPVGRGGPGGGTTQIKATPTVKDIAYASASPTQKLDLYLPEGTGPFPLIVNVHGGAFKMGDKSNPAGADEFLANGYAVASVDYRLSGEALAPAQIQDVKQRCAGCAPMRANTIWTREGSPRSASRPVRTWWRCWGLRAARPRWKAPIWVMSISQVAFRPWSIGSAPPTSCKWISSLPALHAPRPMMPPTPPSRWLSVRRSRPCPTRSSLSIRSLTLPPRRLRS